MIIAYLRYGHVATVVFVMVSQVMQTVPWYANSLRVPLYTFRLLQIDRTESLGTKWQKRMSRAHHTSFVPARLLVQQLPLRILQGRTRSVNSDIAVFWISAFCDTFSAFGTTVCQAG